MELHTYKTIQGDKSQDYDDYSFNKKNNSIFETSLISESKGSISNPSLGKGSSNCSTQSVTQISESNILQSPEEMGEMEKQPLDIITTTPVKEYVDRSLEIIKFDPVMEELETVIEERRNQDKIPDYSIQELDLDQCCSKSNDRVQCEALEMDEIDVIKSVDEESNKTITTAQIHSSPKEERKKEGRRKKYPAPSPKPVMTNPQTLDDTTDEVEVNTKTSNNKIISLIIAGVLLLFLIISIIILVLMTPWTSSPPSSLQNITISKDENKYSGQSSFDLLMMFGGNQDPRSFDIITKSNGNCIFPIKYMTDLPFERVGYSIIFHRHSNSLILCGGVDSSRIESNECWKYKKIFNGNQWIQILSYMPNRFSYGAITILNQKLYVIGGFSHGKEMVDNQVMDLRTEVWSKEESLPYPLWGHCAVTIKKRIYVIGGWTVSSKKGSLVLKDVVEFEEKKSWTKVKKIRIPRATHACVPTKLNRKPAILIAGGMDAYQEPINSVEVIFWRNRQQTLVLSSLGNMIQARMRYPGIGIIEKRWIVVAGGEGSPQSVEYYDFREKKWKISPRNKLSAERINGASAVVPSNWFKQCLPT